MTKNSCFMLSNGLYITDKKDNKLNFAPCCVYGKNIFANSNWAGDKDWDINCYSCFEQEKNNIASHRQKINVEFANIQTSNIVFLEINYSNTCNAACGICNATFSSTIAKILKKEGEQNLKIPNIKQQVFFEEIDNLDLKDLQVIKFGGGEPLYINFHLNALKKLKNTKNIKVIYQSNGSIYPDKEWWDLMKNFKSVHLSFSIDAVGQKFNYIRTKLKFDEIKQNIIRILKNSDLDIQTSIECSLNPLNSFYYDEIFKLYLELKSINKKISLNWHDCWGDWSLANTPPKVRDLISEKYKNNSISKFINTLDLHSENYINFVQSIKKHEKRFNLNGLETFPEIYPLIIDYYKTLI